MNKDLNIKILEKQIKIQKIMKIREKQRIINKNLFFEKRKN